MSQAIIRRETEPAPLNRPQLHSAARARLGQRRLAVMYGVLAGLILTALIAIARAASAGSTPRSSATLSAASSRSPPSPTNTPSG